MPDSATQLDAPRAVDFPIPDDKQRLVALFRNAKEGEVGRTAAGENDDINNYVSVERDGEPIMAVLAPHVDRDEMLTAARALIIGCNATSVVTMADSHVSHQELNPSTGKPWGEREMQHLCDNEGACDLGVITDCLQVFSVGRDGNAWFMTLPYHVHKSARTVAWIEDEFCFVPLEKMAGLSGIIPEALASFFATPPLIDELMAHVDWAELGRGAAEAGGEVPTEAELRDCFQSSLDVEVPLRLAEKGYLLLGVPADA